MKATHYGIVKQSGGHISLFGIWGSATFRIYLRIDKWPRALAPGDVAMPGNQTLTGRGRRSRRTLTRHMLTNFGYTVLWAANGDEAEPLAASHSGAIHLLITDVVMPGAGGRIVAERLAARHPGVRVLFVSGYTDDAVVRHGILEEKIHFLPKPFSPNALAAKIREVLDAPTSSSGTAAPEAAPPAHP